MVLCEYYWRYGKDKMKECVEEKIKLKGLSPREKLVDKGKIYIPEKKIYSVWNIYQRGKTTKELKECVDGILKKYRNMGMSWKVSLCYEK